MKKFLVLLLGMAFAVSASAGINKTAVQKQVTGYSVKAKTEFVTPFKLNRVVDKQVLRTPVTERPDGELRTYVREGSCLYASSGYIYNGTQDGTIDVIFAENNIVWFKNLLWGSESYYGDSYVYGTLSADGTQIAVPMGQSIFWSDQYNADVVLAWGTTVVGSNITFNVDESVTEAIFAVNGTTMTLLNSADAPSGSDYPQYEATGIGCYWTDDNTFGACLDWYTVYTLGATIPQNVIVDPASHTALVKWDADENAEGFDIRWRPWTDLSGNPYNVDFDLENLDADLEGWWIYDADEDGNGWGLAYSSSANDDACLYSFSWSSSTGGITPDNYIGSPDVKLEGVLRFDVWGTSDSWPDVYQVYAMVGEDMYQLFEEDQQTTAAHVTKEVDLSAFEGAEGCIVFRHYNCTNQYAIYIDNVFIGDPNAEIIEPAAWNYITSLETNEGTIEGLTPGTKYEVQVMSYNGNQESDWSPIVEFTTLYDVYMLGGDDQGWDPTQGTLFTYDDGVYTATITFPAELNYFGFTTELAENNDEGGWNYIEPFRFGAIADEGSDYWYTGEEDFISLTWDAYHAIRIPGGEYKLTVDLNEMKLYIEKIEAPQGLRGDVNMSNDVTIADVTALIDYLLTNNAEGISLENANCNLDEGVTIADVTALIDYLLSGNWAN